MNDFKKGGSSRFGKDSRSGGFSRPSFGGGAGARRPSGGGRDFNGPSELYKATCSKCHNACEVPFRPNGKKPVFCKDCFVRDDARPTNDRFEKRSYDARPERESYAPRAQAPVEDPRIASMQKELSVVHAKLDTLIQNLEGAAYSAILTSSTERAEKPEKKVAAKAAPKKAVKKAAKKK